jgi:hypothetical protein
MHSWSSPAPRCSRSTPAVTHKQQPCIYLSLSLPLMVSSLPPRKSNVSNQHPLYLICWSQLQYTHPSSYLIEFRQSITAIVLLSFLDSSAAAGYRSHSQWSMPLVIKPFDHDIDLDVLHTSTNQFGHRGHGAGVIDIVVLAAPASMQQHPCRLACIFWAIHNSIWQSLGSTNVSYICPRLCKFSWP